MLSVVPAGAVAAATKPDNRVTFGIEPVSAGAPEVRSNFSFAVTPGAVVNDNVAVLNFSSAPLSLQLYATDALETTGGGFGLLPAATKPTGVGSWISLPPGSSTVQVPAQTPSGAGQVVVPIAVHVPFKAPSGDHVGGIVASLQTVGTNASGQRVVLDQRVGTRVFVRVSGPMAPKLALTDLRASYDGTLNPAGKVQVQVSYVVSNTGNTDLAVAQSVGVSGLVADSRSVRLPKIALFLPGSSVAEHVTVPGLWPQFLLHTTVTAQPLAEPGTDLSGLVTATSSTWVWAVPWSLIIVVVIVLLAGYWWFRRRRRPHVAPVAAPTQVAQPVGVGQ
ncbi:MAG: DUF916 domain-containing protein [Acidimicrobiales bacterium]